jgi:hypothetical protein
VVGHAAPGEQVVDLADRQHVVAVGVVTIMHRGNVFRVCGFANLCRQ